MSHFLPHANQSQQNHTERSEANRTQNSEPRTQNPEPRTQPPILASQNTNRYITAVKKAEQTKSFIIEKTAPIFNKKGYAGTSMRDITQATGLTKGAIYGNFENKDEVAVAAFEYLVQIINNGIREHVRKTSGAINKLHSYMNFYRLNYRLLIDYGGCPIVNMATEADDTHPLLREKVNEIIIYWKRSIEKIISTGIDNQEIPVRIDPAHYASIFISLLEGAILITLTTGHSSYITTAIDHIDWLIESQLRI